MAIGERLKELRKQKQISQGDVEKRTGLPFRPSKRGEEARALEVPMYGLFTDENKVEKLDTCGQGRIDAKHKTGSQAWPICEACRA